MRHTLVICGAVAAAGLAFGQPDPGDDPELVGNEADRSRPMPRDASSSPDVAAPSRDPMFNAARPHQPERVAAPGRLLPEGTFLVDQPGRLRKAPRGAWVFTATPTADEAPIRPVVLLPSQILGRLSRLVDGHSESTAVRLTGRLTLYRGQNYMLLTAIGEQAAGDAPPAERPDPVDTGDGLSGEVESLIEALEAERTGVRSVISALGPADEAALAPVAEGRVISRRRGRFIRLDAGELAISFDNDDTESPIDAPLVVAPCAQLQAVEESLEIHGDSMTATVSGQTLAFAGRSFLLPISIVLERPSEISTRQ